MGGKAIVISYWANHRTNLAPVGMTVFLSSEEYERSHSIPQSRSLGFLGITFHTLARLIYTTNGVLGSRNKLL